jgi:hypothetical protein
MNTVHLEDELLQRYFDGELSNRSATEVKQHLESCAECQRRHHSLTRLHKLINVTATDAAEGVDFDALFGRIEAGVEEEREQQKVVSIQDWLASTRLKKPLLVAPLAIAAAAAFFIIFQNVRSGQVAQNNYGQKKGEKTVLVENQLPKQPPNSEVVQVDFGANTGTVFEIALADGVSTPVVWINDESDDESDEVVQ